MISKVELLKLATATVEQRSTVHGDTTAHFARLAGLWSTYLDRCITVSDAAAMMILVKVARLADNPENVDNWVDAAGYAACGAEVSGLPPVRQEAPAPAAPKARSYIDRDCMPGPAPEAPPSAMDKFADQCGYRPLGATYVNK